MSLASSRSLAFILTVSVACASIACGGGASEDPSADDSAITASEANSQAFDLKEHLLTGEAASPEAAKALGIVKWDVFAGADKKSGFSGAVYYASDSDGDARYAYSIDIVTKQVAFVILAKNGEKLSDPKIEPEKFKLLVADVTKLKERLEGHSRATSCAIALGVAAGAVLVTAAAVWVAPAAFVLATEGFGVSFAGFGAAIPGLGMVGGSTAFAAASASVAYATYQAVASVADDAKQCATGK